MIIDFRYHVASLVAIFIALGVGIFIGSILVGEDIMENLVSEQKIWIGKLENDYVSLKEETNDLRNQLFKKEREIKKYENFASQIKPYLINNKLIGNKVAIINLGDSQLLGELNKVLEQSGAEVVSTMSIKLANISNLMESLIFLEEIIDLIIQGKKGSFITYLEEKDVMKNNGFMGEEDLNAIIFLNTSEIVNQSIVDKLIIPVINKLNNQFPIYIVESSKTKMSAINQVKNLSNVCIIKDLDYISGQISLILSIQNFNSTASLKPEEIIPMYLEKEKQ